MRVLLQLLRRNQDVSTQQSIGPAQIRIPTEAAAATAAAAAVAPAAVLRPGKKAQSPQGSNTAFRVSRFSARKLCLINGPCKSNGQAVRRTKEEEEEDRRNGGCMVHQFRERRTDAVRRR